MSRLLYRPLRGLLGSSSRTLHQPAGHSVRLETVKVSKKTTFFRTTFTLFKVFLATDLAFLVYRLARDYDPGEVQDKADSLASIPLPLTTRQLPPEVYDKRGPEWTEFKRFAQDDDAQRKVRSDLCRYVFDSIRDVHGPLQDRPGIWLIFGYPHTAPPVWVRTCLRIPKDRLTFELVTVPHDSLQILTVKRFLWPRVILQSHWATGKALIKQRAREAAEYFGFASEERGSPQKPPLPKSPPGPPTPPLATTPGMQKQLQQMGRPTTQRPEAVNNPGSSVSSPAAAPAAASAGKTAPIQTGQDAGNDEARNVLKELPIYIAASQSWKDLREAYRKRRPRLIPVPSRGAIRVTGVVEARVQNHFAVFDVEAFYDPKTLARDSYCTRISLRTSRPVAL